MTDTKNTFDTRMALIASLREANAPTEQVLGSFFAGIDPVQLGAWASTLPETYLKGILSVASNATVATDDANVMDQKGAQAALREPGKAGSRPTAKATAKKAATPKAKKAAAKKTATPKKGAASANGKTPPPAGPSKTEERMAADKERILQVITTKGGEVAMGDIVKATGIKKPRAGLILTALREAKAIKKTGDRGTARYQVAAH